MIQNKEAVIFDLDGTLVDSMWMWRQIDIDFLGARGLELPDGFQQEIEGMSFTETAFYCIKRFGLTETAEELKQIWNEMAIEVYSKQIGFKPGAEEFLKYCQEAGLKMGIATSNSHQLVDAVAKSCNLYRYIDVVVTSCDVNRGKPAPDVYLEAARRLAAAPEHCLVFEDIPAGILAGKNANMTVCAVEDDYSKEQEEEKRRLADFYIHSYHQLMDQTYE